MSDKMQPKLAKWPFLAGDALLLVAAYGIYARSQLPLNPWELSFAVFCLAAGAVLSIVPFLVEYDRQMKVAQTLELTSVVDRIQQLEEIGERISTATSQWQYVQEQADKTANTAQSIASQMTTELRNYGQLMEQADSKEKSNLRLEVDKLRRGEADYLQTMVRMLDHTFALYQGAVRSDQPNVIQQVGQFQSACRDAARRVGLAPFVPAKDDPYDPQSHRTVEANGNPDAGSLVEETVATGFTYQGRLLRPALVRLRSTGNPQPTEAIQEPPPPQADSEAGLPGDPA